MSTRSNIGIANADGTITFVYCHFDGYPEHHGPILLGRYATEARARELLSHGHISILGERCDKPAGHSFETPSDGYTLYYGRDRGEKQQDAITVPAVEAVDQFDEEYGYLFDVFDTWFYREGKGDFKRLTPAAWGGVEPTTEDTTPGPPLPDPYSSDALKAFELER